MKTKELSVKEIQDIQKAMEVRINELSQLIKQASLIMSKVTRYTSVAIAPEINNSTLKAIQVVLVEIGKALVIVVTNTGIVRNNVIRISDSILSEVLIRLSNLLNDKLCGLAIDQISLHVINGAERLLGISKEDLVQILSEISESIKQIYNSEVYLEGTMNMFNYPEFGNIVKAKEFLHLFDEKEILIKIINTTKNVDRINVQIGAENVLDEIKDCSVVTVTYSLSDVVIGAIGVIGPTRMEYSRVISSMNYITEKINQEIHKLMGDKIDKL